MPLAKETTIMLIVAAGIILSAMILFWPKQGGREIHGGYEFVCPGGQTEVCRKTGEIKFRVRTVGEPEALRILAGAE